eukprot:GHUV01018923.1.p2 GENE.GHUV01018923.1~~GHUV01018923.1.p2  ORF type:complete len:105 (+),score=25.34 GHUV01018923.1:395-709(+)
MRKLIPCYLEGFQTAGPKLQSRLFAAASVAEWQAAVADPEQWCFDPGEQFPISALRKARYKGGRQQSRKSVNKVVLPVGWLSEGESDSHDCDILDGMDESACEG